jgi:hypothetical protein
MSLLLKLGPPSPLSSLQCQNLCCCPASCYCVAACFHSTTAVTVVVLVGIHCRRFHLLCLVCARVLFLPPTTIWEGEGESCVVVSCRCAFVVAVCARICSWLPLLLLLQQPFLGLVVVALVKLPHYFLPLPFPFLFFSFLPFFYLPSKLLGCSSRSNRRDVKRSLKQSVIK